jgi:pimeloyl-ACP methyl ester carboxylesterase
MRTLPWLAALLWCVGVAQAEDVRIQAEGITLNAHLEKADNWPAGPVVLMTHGTLAHNRMEIMATLQELFAEHGVSSLAINLSLGIDDRPSAMYDCQVPHRHRHEDAVAEIGRWVAWLKERGAKRIVLLGHSRGGNQTAWYAAEHDDPAVSRVILIAPMTWSPEYAARDYEKRYGKPLAPVLKEAEALVAAGKPDVLLGPMGFIYCKDAKATAAAVVSYYGPDMRKDTPSLLPKVNEAVLVFVGSEDQVVQGLEEKLAPLAGKGAVEVVVIDGADHFFRDLYAEELVEAAVEFFGE